MLSFSFPTLPTTLPFVISVVDSELPHVYPARMQSHRQSLDNLEPLFNQDADGTSSMGKFFHAHPSYLFWLFRTYLPSPTCAYDIRLFFSLPSLLLLSAVNVWCALDCGWHPLGTQEYRCRLFPVTLRDSGDRAFWERPPTTSLPVIGADVVTF